MVYIYLGFEGSTYESKDSGVVDATINVTKELYDKCCSFHVRKYKIEHSTSYDISQTTNSGSHLYIYTGSYDPTIPFDHSSVQHLYHYFPSDTNGIVNQVDAYYLSDVFPFALVFTTWDSKKIYCTYEHLRIKGTSSILDGTLIKDGNLCKLLHRDCKKPGECKVFQFILGSGSNNVDSNEQKIGSGKKFKKIIFTPKKGLHTGSGSLFSQRLFTEQPTRSSGLENEIEESCLNSLKSQSFNAVIVYYTDSPYNPVGLAILIEFVKGCKTTHIRRTCNKPPIWLKLDHPYDDEQLTDQLGYIKEEIESVITYNLDINMNSSDYQEGTIKVTQESYSGYYVYTHIPLTNGAQPILLYKGKQIDPVTNKNITRPVDRLKESDTDVFDSISTYSLSTTPFKHLLIRVTKKSINYYLYRFNHSGFRWRQLGLDELAEFRVITKHEMEQKKIKVSTEGLAKQINEVLQDINKTKSLLEEIKFKIKSIVIIRKQKFQLRSTRNRRNYWEERF